MYHDKAERTYVADDGTSQTEGHHCKLVAGVGSKCECRCHMVFRHDYNPLSTSNFLYGCGPLTATVCNPGGVFDTWVTDAPTPAPTEPPTPSPTAPSYVGKACYDNWQAGSMCTNGVCPGSCPTCGQTANFVMKPTHYGASNDEWKVWCSGGASKGHYMGVCRNGELFSPKRWDAATHFECNIFAAQENGAVTTCGYWGRGCTNGATDFVAGNSNSGGAARSPAASSRHTTRTSARASPTPRRSATGTPSALRRAAPKTSAASLLPCCHVARAMITDHRHVAASRSCRG